MPKLPEDFAFPPDSWADACVYTTYDLTKEQVEIIYYTYSVDPEVQFALHKNGHMPGLALGEYCLTSFMEGVKVDLTNVKKLKRAFDVLSLSVVHGILTRRNLTDDNIRLILDTWGIRESTAEVARRCCMHPACSDELKLELTLRYS